MIKGLHPHEHSLALFASQDAGWWKQRALGRHLRDCGECREKVVRFESLRHGLREESSGNPATLNWDALAAEMRANIRLGLEAGACVRTTPVRRKLNPRLAVAFASILIVVAASFLLRGSHALVPAETTAADTVMPAFESASSRVEGRVEHPDAIPAVLEGNRDGIALRTGPASMTLLGRQGSTLSQTASAEGEIRARYVDGNTGVVTINNVYLQ